MSVTGLLECGDCGFWFRPPTAPDPATQHDDDYFGRYAGAGYLAQDDERTYEARLRLDWLVACGARPPGQLLEIGSAAGQFVAAAAELGWQARGLEANDGIADHARRVLGAEVSTGLVEDLDEPDASYDLIVMWHVLEHIPEPLTTIRRLRDMLAPGGMLAVEVPNLGSREALVQGSDWVHLNDPNHVSHFAPASMRALMSAAGLKVQGLDTVAWRHYARRRSTRLMWWLASTRQERGWTWSPHPTAQPLLRACARRPPRSTA